MTIFQRNHPQGSWIIPFMHKSCRHGQPDLSNSWTQGWAHSVLTTNWSHSMRLYWNPTNMSNCRAYSDCARRAFDLRPYDYPFDPEEANRKFPDERLIQTFPR